jgi:hypothetical protein
MYSNKKKHDISNVCFLFHCFTTHVIGYDINKDHWCYSYYCQTTHVIGYDINKDHWCYSYYCHTTHVIGYDINKDHWCYSYYCQLNTRCHFCFVVNARVFRPFDSLFLFIYISLVLYRCLSRLWYIRTFPLFYVYLFVLLRVCFETKCRC